jgi:hypothetical protein
MEHHPHNPEHQSVSHTLQGPVALFTSAWNLFVKHWKFLVPLFLIPSVLIYLGNILKLMGGPVLAIISLILVLAGVILSVAQRASAIHAIHQYSTHHSGELSLKQEYRIGFKFFWPMVWVTILVGLLFFGSVIFLIIPAIVIGIYTMFYSFILVLDGKRGMDTFIESYLLVRGRWVDVVGRLLFLALATVGAYLVIAGAVFFVNLAFALVAGSAAANSVAMISNLIMSAIIGPVTVGYLYYMYESLKKTRTHHTAPPAIRRWLKALLIIGLLVTIALPFIVAALLISLPQ